MATLKDIVSEDLNYEVWAPIVKCKLSEKGLWDVVENGIRPDPSKNPELAATIQPEDLCEWRDSVGKDTKALQVLQLSLPASVFRKTLQTASAKDLWDLLRESNEQAKLQKRKRISSNIDEVLEYDPSLADAALFFTKLVISLSDQYWCTGTALVMEKLTFNNLREILDMFESEPLEIGYSSDERLMFLSDSCYRIGTAPVMKEHKGQLNVTYNKLRRDLDTFESALVGTVNELLRGLEVGSSSQSQEDDSTREGQFKRGKGVQFGGGGHFSRGCSNENQSQRPSRQFETDNRSKNKVLPEYQMLALDTAGLTFDEDMWIIYMTTSNHMTPYEKYFTNLDRTHKARVKFMFGSTIMSEGMGDVMIMHKGKKITIKNVLFVPGINRNVLSVGQMMEKGYGIVMSVAKCTIKDETGRLFDEAMWEERGFFLRLKVIEGNLTS